MIDNNAKLEITCPNCSHEFKARVGDLRSSKVSCPQCSTLFEASDFDKKLRDVEKQLKNFGRNLKF